ncbi:MAG TPA: Na+/H+ antiporter subunit E [Eoetvoesiella sp.]
MKRYFYRLLLPLLLLAIWLLLNNTVSAGQLVLGATLSLLLAWAATALRPIYSRPKRLLVLATLFWHVFVDITRSNIQVAKLIWRGHASHSPGFIKIPIDIRDPHGLAALACIVTYTPGTVWSGFSEKNRIMTLHVLDLKDEGAWFEIIKQRYERPLMEIFE